MIGESLSMLAMEKALEGLWERQRLITDNIANQATPGYKSKKIDFEEALAREIENVKLRAGVNQNEAKDRIRNVKPEVYEFDNLEARLDGNNVDIDQENIELARTQIQYDYMVSKISDSYARLKYAISGGR